jgi:hypothetical protein
VIVSSRYSSVTTRGTVSTKNCEMPWIGSFCGEYVSWIALPCRSRTCTRLPFASKRCSLPER